MELAGLMSYESHELLRAKLLAALTKDPPDPRYSSLSVEHIRAADKEAFRMLAKTLRSGVKPLSPADPPPANKAVEEVLASVEFNLFLLPLPCSKGSASASGEKRRSEDDGNQGPAKKSRNQRRQAQLVALRSTGDTQRQPTQPTHEHRQPQGGARANRTSGPMPRQLIGGVATLPDGTRLCFSFNLGNCRDAAPGESCRKGKHLCTKRGCQGKHPAVECSL